MTLLQHHKQGINHDTYEPYSVQTSKLFSCGDKQRKISHLTAIEEKEIKTLAVFDTFIFVKEDKKKRLVFQYNKSTDLFHLL